MCQVSGEASLARALLALGRSRQTGALEIVSRAQRCRVALVDGTVVGAKLGRVPVPPEVALAAMFAHGGTSYRFFRASRSRARYRGDRRSSIARVVLEARVRSSAHLALDGLLASLDIGRLYLTPLGLRLLASFELGSPEERMSRALTRGSSLPELRLVVGGSLPALRTLAAIQMLSGIQQQQPGQADYPLLLRKRLQLRRAANAHALLEIPEGARPAQARQALRRFARKLHPDCLGPDVADDLRAASSRVMGALIEAEVQVRAASR